MIICILSKWSSNRITFSLIILVDNRQQMDKKTAKKKNGKKGKDQDKSEVCEVCRSDYFSEDIFEKLICQCNRWVHKYCYCPDLKDKKNFKCDECKKDVKATCFICQKQNGILKQIGNNQFVHILCALTSPKIKIVSYKSLEFKLSSTKTSYPKKTCYICNINSEHTMACGCSGCQNYAHVGCVNSYQNTDSFLVFNLFDKNQNNLLHHNLQSHWDKFRGIQFLKSKKSCMKIFICHLHNDRPNFLWCVCGKQKPEDKQMIECSRCKRWLHKSCTGLKHKDARQVDYECKGCQQNNIFKKCSFLPEILSKMGDIEAYLKLDKKGMKFLDCFPFKLSQAIIRNLSDKKHCFEIEKYYLRKVLQYNFRRPNEEIKENKGFNDPTNIQILYYLAFRQLKKNSQISIEDLKLCQKKFLDKNIDWEWIDSSIAQKIKILIDQSMRTSHKGEISDIREKVNSFIKKNQSFSKRDLSSIAHQIKQIILSLQKNDAFRLPSEKSPRKFFELFYHSKINEDQIFEILQAYRKIMSLRDIMIINEGEYNQIMKKIHQMQIPDLKREALERIFTQILKDFKIRWKFQQKNQKRVDFQRIIEQGNTNLAQRQAMKQKLIKDGIFIDSMSPFVKSQINQIFYQVMKFKCLRQIIQPKPADIEKILKNIGLLIQKSGHSIDLSKADRRELTKFQAKYTFFSVMINYAVRNKGITFLTNEIPVKIQDQVKIQVQGQQEISEGSQKHSILRKRVYRPAKQNNLIFQRFTQVIMQIGDSETEINFVIEQLVVLAEHKTQFNEQEKNVISHFIQRIIQTSCRKYKEFPSRLKPIYLEKIYKIIVYAHLQESFRQLVVLHSKFKEWKKEFQTTFQNVEQILEDESLVGRLLTLIDIKQREADCIDLDMVSELKKLKIVKMWCLISQKILQADEKKATITSIQQLKILADKVCYPKNRIMLEILQLQSESRILNKKITRFFQKPKYQEFQIFEQLRYMTSKMTYTQAQELKKNLEQTSLDVFVELQQLEEEMRSFRLLPTNLSSIIQAATQSDQLMAFRKRIIQSPFRYQYLEHYDLLNRRIYHFKCLEFDGNTCRKDYMKLLNLGGLGSVELLSKTQNLYKSYKQIERAERELANIKPRQEYLLPIDSKRWRSELKQDSFQKQNLDKWYIQAQRLRQRFQHLRSNLSQYDKFVSVESELMSLPIYSKDISIQLLRMKRELDDILLRVQKYEFQYDSSGSVELIARYRNNGLRHPTLDRFQKISAKYRTLTNLGRNISSSNYKQFSLICEEFTQFLSHPQVCRLRQRIFLQMAELCINSTEPLIQICVTLLSEGGFLCRNMMITSQVLQWMYKINEKHKKAIQDISQSDQMASQGYGDDQGDPEDDQFEEDEDEYDDHEYDSDASEKQVAKRKRQDQVVDLDDQ